MAAALIGAGATAAEPPVREANVEEAVEACSSIGNEADRLACFDSMARALREETEAPPRAAEERAQQAAVPANDRERQLLIVRKDEPAAKALRPSPFTARISRVWEQFGKIFVRLDNGETWKQTSRSRPRLPTAGQTATFTKGLIGGWLVSFGDAGGKYSFSPLD